MANAIAEKSYVFAKMVINTTKKIKSDHQEFALANQLQNSGTAIGAMVVESEHAESRADFIHKLAVALKEANESRYWIRLCTDGGFITQRQSEELLQLNTELIKILASILIKLKKS